MMTMSKENMISMISQWFSWSFWKFHTSVQTRQEGEVCCNYFLLLKEFGTIMRKFSSTCELVKRVLSYYGIQHSFRIVMQKFACLCEVLQRHKTVAVIHISFTQSCENWGKDSFFAHFQTMKTLLFLAWFPLFLHECTKWW